MNKNNIAMGVAAALVISSAGAYALVPVVAEKKFQEKTTQWIDQFNQKQTVDGGSLVLTQIQPVKKNKSGLLEQSIGVSVKDVCDSNKPINLLRLTFAMDPYKSVVDSVSGEDVNLGMSVENTVVNEELKPLMDLLVSSTPEELDLKVGKDGHWRITGSLSEKMLNDPKRGFSVNFAPLQVSASGAQSLENLDLLWGTIGSKAIDVSMQQVALNYKKAPEDQFKYDISFSIGQMEAMRAKLKNLKLQSSGMVENEKIKVLQVISLGQLDAGPLMAPFSQFVKVADRSDITDINKFAKINNFNFALRLDFANDKKLKDEIISFSKMCLVQMPEDKFEEKLVNLGKNIIKTGLTIGLDDLSVKWQDLNFKSKALVSYVQPKSDQIDVVNNLGFDLGVSVDGPSTHLKQLGESMQLDETVVKIKEDKQRITLSSELAYKKGVWVLNQKGKNELPEGSIGQLLLLGAQNWIEQLQQRVEGSGTQVKAVSEEDKNEVKPSAVPANPNVYSG